MLQPYIRCSTLIHKLVLFDQPPYKLTFYDHGTEDPCIALCSRDQLAIQFRVNIQAFLVTAHRIRITCLYTRVHMYSIYILSTDGIR